MGSTFSCTLNFSSNKNVEEILDAFKEEGFSPNNSEIFACKKTSDTGALVTFVRDVSYSSVAAWPEMLTSALDKVGFQYECDGSKIFYIIDLYSETVERFTWDAKVKL